MLIKLWLSFRGYRALPFGRWRRPMKARRRPRVAPFSSAAFVLEARTLPGGSLANPATPFLATAALGPESQQHQSLTTSSPDQLEAQHALSFVGTAHAGGGAIGSHSVQAWKSRSSAHSDDRRSESQFQGGSAASADSQAAGRKGHRSTSRHASDGLATPGGPTSTPRRSGDSAGSNKAPRSNTPATASSSDGTNAVQQGTAGPALLKGVGKKVATGNLEGAQRKVSRLAQRHANRALRHGGNPVSNQNSPTQGGQPQNGGGGLGGFLPFGNLGQANNQNPPTPPSGLNTESPTQVDPVRPAADSFSDSPSFSLMLAESSAPESPVGFYRGRIEPGLALPTLGAVASYQSVSDIETATSNDPLSPQIPGETETFDNEITTDSTTDTETGADETLGDYTRTITWTTHLTRNGDHSSYTEYRLKTYTVVTEYTDENDVESTLTQTGTTVDDFQLETYIDPVTSESSIRTATSHTETDHYEFAQAWTTTETDSDTGDLVVTSLVFAASGNQSFSIAGADVGDPELAPMGYSAGQSETAYLGISLATTLRFRTVDSHDDICCRRLVHLVTGGIPLAAVWDHHGESRLACRSD